MSFVLLDFLTDSPVWLIYLGVLFGPFVQEDAAVIAAATLSVTQVAKTVPVFILICIGLFMSDIWKYWIGWAALKNKSGQVFAEKRHISNMQDKVLTHTFTTLIVARFIPLTRIPAYVACGFFGVSYLKFCAYIAITALLYTIIIFGLFHALGAVLGEKILWILPVIAITGLVALISYYLIKRKIKAQTRHVSK